MTATAMILAAGRGERMRPLSDRCPKPLLPVGGRPMIEWHLDALAAAGVREVLINIAWLEAQFPATLGDGHRFGLQIRYSHEGRDHGGALDVAGGIATARARLAEVFWLVSGDIVARGFRFDPAALQAFADGPDDAHLWLVPNPPFHPGGDFACDAQGRVSRPDAPGQRPFTFASVALLRRRLFDALPAGRPAALAPVLAAAAAAGRVGGSRWHGEWHNVGTPAQLAALQGAAAVAASGTATGALPHGR